MSISTIQDLFLNELKDIYSAEKQAVRSGVLYVLMLGSTAYYNFFA